MFVQFVGLKGSHCLGNRPVLIKDLGLSAGGEVGTIAGGSMGFADGHLSAAQFKSPFGIASDKNGNLFVADYGNQLIRQINQSGQVSTLAGIRYSTHYPWEGYIDGSASAARFQWPMAVAVDDNGNVFVADTWNHRIRKITPTGIVSTFAGSGSLGGDEYAGGYEDGPATVAKFRFPSGLAFDSDGNLMVLDHGNYCLRKVTPAGVVSTFAGSGTQGGADGSAGVAKFQNLQGIAINEDGTIYVADGRIRKISPQGDVMTLVGSNTMGYFSSNQAFFTQLTLNRQGKLFTFDRGCIFQVESNGTLIPLAGQIASFSSVPL